MDLPMRLDPKYRYITFDRPYGHRNRYLSDSAISVPLLSSDSSLNASSNNSLYTRKSPVRNIASRRAQKKQKTPKNLRIKICQEDPAESYENSDDLPFLTPTDKQLADKIVQLRAFAEGFKEMVS